MYFDVDLSGSFFIHNAQLCILPEQTGAIVLPSAIPELKAVDEIIIDADEYRSTLDTLRGIKEKCNNPTNLKCNSCGLSNKSICIMKLFMTNPMYRPSPHQGGEFGDISFSVTLNGYSQELVGIAKSAIKGKDVLTRSESSGRDMIQQVFSATHDARIGIVASICPMRFHDQLVEDLRYLAILTGKPIVILDEMFMIKQLKAYNTSRLACR